MPELQGLATFPGIGQIEAASVSLTVGISPSVAIVTMLPQEEDIQEYGTLTFAFGDSQYPLIECKADYGRLQVDRNGRIWQVGIFDRRWKWKFGTIGGQYNLRNSDNTLKEGTGKTPQELAKLCLAAMGETVWLWNVGDLPNETDPLVKWDLDNPAEALARLCESLGCIVVPQFHQRGGKICVAGTGAELPQGGVENVSTTFDPPEVPTRISVACGPDKWEVDFELEAVGGESDDKETIKKIDDLTYRPSGGWGVLTKDAFAKIANDKGKKARDCAERSVWKWYRIKIPEGGIIIPGYAKPITSLDCILLEDRRVDVSVDQDVRETVGDGYVQTTEKTRRKPAVIFGEWYPEKDGVISGNVTDSIDPDNPDGRKYSGGFSIDAERRMVKFAEAIYKNSNDTGKSVAPEAPDIRLRTACTLLDPETRQPVRSYKYIDTGVTFDTKELVIRHDEIVLGHTAAVPTGVNLAEVEAELDHYLQAKLLDYQPKVPQSATYMGWIPVWLDGAIRQITFEVDKSGARTTVSRNTEDINWVEPYHSRRVREKQRAAWAAWDAEEARLKTIEDRHQRVLANW